MNNLQLIRLAYVLACLAALAVVAMDLFVWRPN
jgi:hypothetical protein